jgi:MoxR-like ATPase
MLRERDDGNPPPAQPLLDRAGLLRCQALVDEVFTPEAVAVLIAKLVAISAPSHPDAPEEVRTHVRYGASPRAAIWLARIARALAFIDGRPGVAFEDVAAAVPHVLGHRLILSHSARLDGIRAADLATRLHTHVEQTVLDAAGSRRRSPEQSRA